MSTTETPPPPPPPPPSGGPRVDGDAARDLGRLRRTHKSSPEGRYLGGVAGGIARHLDIDPLVVRVTLLVLIFFGGAGLLVYAACWLLVPEEDAQTGPVRVDERSRNVLLWVVAGLAVLAVVGDSFGHFHLPWPLIIIGLIVLWLATSRRVRTAWEENHGTRAATETAAAAPDAPDAAAAADPGATAAAPLARPVREPDPRKQGPVLFWFTLALIALAEGILGTVDLAGAHIAGPAYPALALGITGLMLVLGAFYGRAGGLILVGLVATLALVGATIGDRVGPRGNIDETPTTAAAVAPAYHVGAGSMTLDLTQVSDPAALDGRTIDVGINLGDIDVIVPAGMGVDLRATVHGPGNVKAFGDDHGGVGVTYDHVYPGTPMITLVADLKAGELDLKER